MEKINNLARKHSERAIHLLVKAMDDEAAPWNVRIRAAELILDRALGKPVTPTEIKVEGDISIQHQHLLAIKAMADRRLQTHDADNQKLKYAGRKVAGIIDTEEPDLV
jgi:hypothetical protein